MVTRQEFEELVDQALEEIPAEFMEKLENVEILVEEEPSRELLREVGIRGGTLFGLYQGIPETRKSSFHLFTMPDRILIFRRPILRACRTRGQVVREIRKTVMHEVAHHFGFSEERLRELGYG